MPPFDWSKIRTRPLAERKNKVRIEQFSPGPAPGRDVLDLMPDILAGRDWREFIDLAAHAAHEHRALIVMIGGHVVKTGLAPLLIDLMERGIVTHLAMNGAAAIHDYEIALIGQTSEDVAEYLEDGRFGLWDETGRGINGIVTQAACIRGGPGFGAALGQAIAEGNFAHKDFSLLAAAWELGIPATVHAAIGAEIIHEHPLCSGAAIGEASYRDFKRLAETIYGLDGGVVMNWGSAVILPEVFLKALAVARNLAASAAASAEKGARSFTSATFDMIRHYRPLMNVVERPTGQALAKRRGETATAGAGTAPGRGFFFTGHHEFLIPLFWYSLDRALRRLSESSRPDIGGKCTKAPKDLKDAKGKGVKKNKKDNKKAAAPAASASAKAKPRPKPKPSRPRAGQKSRSRSRSPKKA